MASPELILVQGADNDPNEDSPLVPAGIYQLAFEEYHTRVINNADKLEIRFRILDTGLYFQKRLSCYFNVKILGKPRKSGNFKAGKKSRAYRELAKMLVFTRGDRIPVSLLGNMIVEGSVRNVRRDSRQKPITERAQYSVIDELLGSAS